MASEIVNNVRENTKMSFNKGIFDFFMNKYLEQDMNTYSSNEGESLFNFIKIDSVNAYPMNMEDYKGLIGKILDASIKDHIAKGIAFNKDIVVKKIIGVLNGRDKKLTFSSEELFDDKINGEKNVLIYIDVKGEDIIKIVDEIINKFTEEKVAYDITTPSFTEMSKGHTDAICINTSVEDFERVVMILDSVSEETKSKANNNDYAKSNWYGINTIKDGVLADALLGKLFIQSMNELIEKTKEQHPEVVIEDNTNKDLYRKNAYNELIKVDEKLGDNIFNRLLELIKGNDLDINNMYVFNTINNSLDSLYKLKSIDDTVPIPDINRALTAPVEESKAVATPEEQQPTVEEPTEVDYKKIEIADPEDVSAISEPDRIVSDTMEIVAEEVREIVKEETGSISSPDSISITTLTPEEKVSMASAIDEVQSNLDIENKYLGLLDGVEGWTYDSDVKDIDGKTITLLQFLEKNNTLAKVPFNSEVVLLDNTTEDGVSVSGKKFISKYVLDSIKLNATNPNVNGLTLEEILEKYVDKIVTEEYGVIYPEGLTSPVRNNKVNFLRKVFKGR